MTTKRYSPGESAESLKSWATKLLDDPSCRILGERLNNFADAWLAERGVSSTETRAALQSQPQETIAYVTRNEEGDRAMLFFDLKEARLYCNPGEEPEALVLADSALQSQEYTAAIGGAGQAYLDRFKNAHALPAEFRWNELWAVMCVAANKGRPDALQSQDKEDAAYESGRRCGLGFAHSVVSEILRKHYYGSGVEGLSKLVQQATDALAREINNPTTATTDIDHARHIEGEGE